MSIYSLDEINSNNTVSLEYPSTVLLNSDAQSIQQLPEPSNRISRAALRRWQTETISQKNIMNLKITSQLVDKPKTEEVAAVLKKYGNPNQAIFKAAEAGDQESVTILLDYGARYVDALNVQNGVIRWNLVDGKIKWNIMDSACRSGNIDLIKYLFEVRKILPINDPLITLVKTPSPLFEGIDFFLSKGYKFSSEIIFDTFYQSQLTSPLGDNLIKMHHTTKPILIPKIETIKFLINRGARIQDLDNFRQISGLEHIWHCLLHNLYCNSEQARLDAREMIKILLPIGLNPNVNSHGMPYTPPYVYCSSIGSLTTSLGDSDTLPLGVAIRTKNIELIKALLDAGADPNRKTEYYIWDRLPRMSREPQKWHWVYGSSTTPLQMAVDNVEITTLLLEYGAKI